MVSMQVRPRVHQGETFDIAWLERLPRPATVGNAPRPVGDGIVAE